MLCTIYWETKHLHSIWLLHVVVGDGGGGLSSIWNVFTDITFVVYDYISLVDLGDMPGTCPPVGPNSFIYTYIFTKTHLHWRSMPPNPHLPYRKSWICHCIWSLAFRPNESNSQLPRCKCNRNSGRMHQHKSSN